MPPEATPATHKQPSRLYTTIAGVLKRAPLLLRVPYFLYRLIQPRYTVGVVGVILNSQGEVLLVEHVFHPEFPWGLPGGWIGRNEAPEQAVAREIQEELAMSVTIETLLIMDHHADYNHLDFAFLCRTQDQVGELSYELLSYGWYHPDDSNIPQLYPFHRAAIRRASMFQES